MTQLEKLQKLNEYLLNESPQYRQQAIDFGKDEASQFQLFRSLVNIRMPGNISPEFERIQNEYLTEEIEKKGITNIRELSPVEEVIYLWQGDITTLKCDAIVNAANSQMLGCFCPCHGCIDNAIHTYAGIQLRNECAEIMKKQGHEEKTGTAKITKGYNLPCKYVLHTVGPIVQGKLRHKYEDELKSCYLSCLSLADEYRLQNVAFCCISTGEFHFPNDRAAQIAVQTVREYKENTKSKIEVIFNVFKQIDYDYYRNLLG